MFTSFKKFNLFENKFSIITDEEYEEYLNLVDNYFSDVERSKDDLDYYTEKLQNLQNNGGQIYRLVFLKDEESLNKDFLGNHWNIDGNFDNFYDSLEYGFDNADVGDLKPFIIIAKIQPNNINVEDSYDYYTEFPNELEINIYKQPTEYIIKPFEKYRDYTKKLFENYNNWYNYLKQIEDNTYSNLTGELWQDIQDDGYPEEVNHYFGDFNRNNYTYTELNLPSVDIQGLQTKNTEYVEKWNDFDIYFKENGYYPKYLDFIDYDKGKIYIVKHQN